MRRTHLTGMALALLIASCGTDADRSGSTSSQDTLTTGTAPPPLTPETGTPAPVAAPQAGGTKLNPAHGEAGHRCDIAVGAPLDSKPVPTPTVPASAPATASPAPATKDMVISATGGSTTITPQINTPQPTNSKLNPAHGEPGHRCDIAVGAPLDSKPAPAATVPVAAPATTSPPPAPAPAPSITTTAPGMNPAHGQPGHRCDIAVGAPLNSSPQKKGN
ncbi:MAG: hypothetical protein RJA57_2017 [Bacteroidota bacterium]